MSATGTINDELKALREQVDQLMANRVNPALSQIADQAVGTAGSIRDAAQHQADRASSKVRDQPLVSVAIAACAGFLLGRITR